MTTHLAIGILCIGEAIYAFSTERPAIAAAALVLAMLNFAFAREEAREG